MGAVSMTLSFRLCAKRWRNPCLEITAIDTSHLGEPVRHRSRTNLVRVGMTLYEGWAISS